MHPRFNKLPRWSPGIGVPWRAIHHGEAERARLGELKAEIVMHAGHGMVMLVDDKVAAVGLLVSPVERAEVGEAKARL